ncbi:helix-turn-helix domain-containing protein [Chromobacterium sp. IIBBL 290-4]|uniref:helix-turn-helix domain-containing protein n=1 Tax=Chromobacterium sp. IIBBL 290-4 TaxID=2953890 RepID=UPI0020B8978B|nr:helix-turn-helix domain-containing protein [Chromobacterium sp. IIBBL 290-4]UTH76234.1 helix-turn-helix domain-containing protein [Chromobacterium sp. IIBBL 290-4]
MTDDFKPLFLSRLTQLLELRGIAERERNVWLKNLLEIDLSSANRKLRGGIALNIEELAKVAGALSCSSDYLLGLTSSSQEEAAAFQSQSLSATLRMEGLASDELFATSARAWQPAEGMDSCIVWLGKIERANNARNVAWRCQDSGEWWFGLQGDAPGACELRPVIACLMVESGLNNHRVAVVDDRAETAEVMQSFLEQAGFLADTFTGTAAARAALQTTRYDAFVLDWSMGQGENTEPLIEEIRRTLPPDTPIMLITGEASEAEIERAIDRHGVRYFQKTGLFKPIVAQLKKDLREQEPGGEAR